MRVLLITLWFPPEPRKLLGELAGTLRDLGHEVKALTGFPNWPTGRVFRWGGRVIYFSIDCVFSGRHGGYVEEDLSDAEDLYGKTKFLGDVASANALTLRTSVICRELTEHRSLLARHQLWRDHQLSRRAGRLDHPGTPWIARALSNGQLVHI